MTPWRVIPAIIPAILILGGSRVLSAEPVSRGFSIPLIDYSKDTDKHVIVEPGTEEIYQGHPTTVLLPDGKTILAVWTRNHGGPCGPMKKSTDGGLTWEDVVTPPQWKQMRNCPSIYRLSDPGGRTRLIIYAKDARAEGETDSEIVRAVSEDDGKTWSDMKGIGIDSVMPWCTIIPIEGGKKLLAATNARRVGDPEPYSNNTIQSTSTDGGLTWSKPRIICDMPGYKPCEPCFIRSPDGKQIVCLMRENTRKLNALYMTSDDEGKTWSEPKQLQGALTGDRHQAKYAPDGRLGHRLPRPGRQEQDEEQLRRLGGNVRRHRQPARRRVSVEVATQLQRQRLRLPRLGVASGWDVRRHNLYQVLAR